MMKIENAPFRSILAGMSIAVSGFCISAWPNPADRLYFKSGGKIAAAMDPGGSFYSYAEKGWNPASVGSGLVFKKNGQTMVAMTEEGIDPTVFGKVHNTSYIYTSSPVPYHPSGTLVFKSAGTAIADFDHVDGSINMTNQYCERFAYRKNAAWLNSVERQNFVDAIAWSDNTFYPGQYGVESPAGSGLNGMGRVSHWDKNAQIHQNRGMFQEVHGGPLFIPWHREFVNRMEDDFRTFDPIISIPYWDWQTDPKGSYAGDANAIVSSARMGTTGFLGIDWGRVDSPLGFLDNNGILQGSYEVSGNPADPPQTLDRFVHPDNPMTADVQGNTLIDDAAVMAPTTFEAFRINLEENAHDFAHTYLGDGPDRGEGEIYTDRSPADPMFWLIHSNCDRLWAVWQNADASGARKNPATAYGGEGNQPPLNGPVEPWSGGRGIRPWAFPDNYQVPKLYSDPSILNPRLYY